jgi:hypothetical protein
MRRAYAENPQRRSARAEATARRWQDPDYRRKMTATARKPRSRPPVSEPRCEERCEWRGCDEPATIGLRFGKLKVRGKVESCPAVAYCRPHAQEACGLFHVDRQVALGSQPPKRPRAKPKPKPEPDGEFDLIRVPLYAGAESEKVLAQLP